MRMIGNALAANCAAITQPAAYMRCTAPVGSGVPSRFPRALRRLELHALYGFPSIPKRRECRSYGWSLETRLLLRDRYNRCII
jgi:hypothetical protein